MMGIIRHSSLVLPTVVWLGAAILAIVAMDRLATRTVHAEHMPGAVYTGRHSGGGAVSFTVSEDGSRIVRFAATNVPGSSSEGNCLFPETDSTYPAPSLAIVDDSFRDLVPQGITPEGWFPAPGRAEGTFVVYGDPPQSCTSGTLTWTATAGAPATVQPSLTPTPAAIAAPAPAEVTEPIPLFAACNNVALTWPNATSTSEVAAAVRPAGAVTGIWRYDASTRQFHGFSPQFPNASDLRAVNRLDAVFICTTAPGTLVRPRI